MAQIWSFLRTLLFIVLFASAAVFLREMVPVGAAYTAIDEGDAGAEATVHAATAARPQRYSVIFNDIGPVPYNEPATLVATIATKSERDAFIAVGQGSGPARKDTAEFSGYVRAHLSGPSGFVTIDGDGSAVQFLSKKGNATWSWQVVPKTLRPTRMTLRFFNNVERGGQLFEVPGPTYTATITVKPNLSSRARDLAAEYQNVISFAGVIAPIVTGIFGFFFGQWWERRKAADKVKETRKGARAKSKAS